MLMGRPRIRDKDMPLPGVRRLGGRWYVQPVNAAMRQVFARLFPGRKSAPLGPDKDAARKTYIRLFLADPDPLAENGTVAELVDRYEAEVLPDGAPKTREEERRQCKQLRTSFGVRRYARTEVEAAAGGFLRSLDANQYLRQPENKARPVAANHEIRLLRKIFRCARQLWGLTEYNPCDGAFYHPETPRSHYVEDEAFLAVYGVAPPTLKCMMDLAQMHGPRRQDIIALVLPDIRADGVLLRPLKAKPGQARKRALVQWTPDLREVIDRALALRKKVRGSGRVECVHLFLTRRGTPYTISAFNSLWRRAMKRAIRLEKLSVDSRFTFHDIRRKAGSDAETDAQATEMLVHTDARTTLRVYRAKPKVVTPHARLSKRAGDTNSR